MKVSVVIPCYNEASTIEHIVDAVYACPLTDMEIIVVDDGSTDGTRETLKSKVEHRVAQVVYHEFNRGKGAAIRSGFQRAGGDVLVVQDADLEYNPQEYSKLLGPIFDGNADVVYGSRFLGGDPHRVLYFWHYIGNKFLTLVSNAFTNLNLTDMETCYKAFRREVIEQISIEENRFGFEPEITAKISKQGWRIYEVGISYFGRTYEQGKKINWRDGVRALVCIVKYNLFRGA